MRELYLAPSGPLFGCRINKLAVPARLQDRSSAYAEFNLIALQWLALELDGIFVLAGR